ncbi:hypothetical protein NAC44_00445 [Allorhizobium sp. BGMRC 0089]|uniref:hypothetical protein n=1 Tax=Allorhizobium sonneratiae TaxID=2934936 RepID=UPI002033AF8E|nr:hypothetical protein [Allorhizobium sonneratiae]MCM2290795.1 hypothetical protein [Allorhizobium sonneratiae]
MSDEPVSDEPVSDEATTSFLTITDPTVDVFTSAAMGQVVSMLGEDARSFLQGMEQIYITAAAKALGMIGSLDPQLSSQGVTLLNNIKTSQADTGVFLKDIADVAKDFVSIQE